MATIDAREVCKHQPHAAEWAALGGFTYRPEVYALPVQMNWQARPQDAGRARNKASRFLLSIHPAVAIRGHAPRQIINRLMMKSLYISRFICFIVFLFCAFDIMAYHDKDIMINGINIRLDQYGTAVVSYYNRGFQGENLVIPSHVTYDGEVYTVTRIETRAFENNQNIESVTIPYTMESIWSDAFKGCINIKEVFWNAKNCGSNGDMYTENIEHLIIGPEVEVLPWGAASGSKITEVTIPNSVTTIGSYAFYNCFGLTSIEIPNSVTTIGYRAFYGCSGLTSINIPNAVTHIGSEAFCGCSGFEDIILPSTLTTLETGVFYNCGDLNTLFIPSSITSYIGSDAFNGCSPKKLIWNVKSCSYNGSMNTSNIEELIIGPEVEVLPENLASGSKITEVTIPNSVTTIDHYAFYNCSGLTRIKISNSVTNIYFGAFEGCSPKELIWNAKNCGSNGDMYTENIEHLVIGPEVEVLPMYLASGSKITEVTIPNSVTTICGGAFKGCSPKELIWNVKNCGYNGSMNTGNIERLEIGPEVEVLPENLASGSKIKEVAIPNSVTTIGNYAFYNCSALTSGIIIPDKVTAIGKSAFQNCIGMNELKIGSSVTSIGEGAFANCLSLKDVTIPDAVTQIGIRAFQACRGMTSLSIGNSVKVIEGWAFEWCDSLTDVTIPNSVTALGIGAFQSCPNLSRVTIGNSLTAISNITFNGCTALTEVTIGNSVTSIGESAFRGCSPKELIWNAKNCGSNGRMNTGNIEHLVIGPEVEVLPENLANGSKITEVTIPNSVTTIGQYAFNSNCLRSIFSLIEDPASVTLGDRVFWNVPKDLCVLHVPSGTEDLYRNADQWKDFLIKEEYEMKTAFSKGFEESFPSSIEPEGVTADGASRMYIYFDEDIDDVKSVDLKCSVIEETSDPAIIGYFGEFKKLPNDKWGFDYRAPEDIVDMYNYKVFFTVKVMTVSNKEWVGYGSFIVMRPGVLLLHGLFGDDGAFGAQYKHLITEGGYYPYQVLNASYKESNAQSFDDNTYCNDVVGNGMRTLFNAFADHGIISSKYDLVGHSMGGILARLYTQEVNPDAVNRIITLNTPHYGSQLADLRDPILDLCKNKSESESFTYIPKKVYSYLYDMFSKPEYDAIQDLKPSSGAIKRLNRKSCAGIPVHAIGSYMTPPSLGERIVHELNPLWQLFLDLAFFEIPEYAKYLNNSDLGYSLMNHIYNGTNDGIVSLTSQLGGLNNTVTDIEDAQLTGEFGRRSNAHHTKTHHWDRTINLITGLLKRPKTDPCFTTSGFKAPANFLSAGEQPAITSVPKFKEAPETSFINLTLNKNEDEDDRNLDATVSASEDIESFFVFACLDDDKCLVSTWETEPTFVIPDNYEGNLVFYVLGRTANDEIVADMDSVEYSSITSLVALDFEDDDDLTMTVGQTLGLNVIATWDNGESEYVKPTYSAFPGGILSIDGQMFTPVAVGECELIAEYKGFTCRKKVTVYPGSEPVTSRFDVNLDGEVSVADVNEVIGLILLPKDGLLGDVNGDGEVNIADINAIIDEILSK